MPDQPTSLGALASPKEEHTTVDVTKIFKQYDKNRTGAIEVKSNSHSFCMNLHRLDQDANATPFFFRK